MSNNEFFELSDKEVSYLNGSRREEAREAWRAGYVYLQQIVKKAVSEDSYDEFVDKMQSIAYEDLPLFK